MLRRVFQKNLNLLKNTLMDWIFHFSKMKLN